MEAAEVLGLVMEDFVLIFIKHFSFSIDKTFGFLLSSVLFMITVLLLQKLFYYGKTDEVSAESQINIIVILVGSIFIDSSLVTFILGILSIVISARTSKKLKEMNSEWYLFREGEDEKKKY